MDTGMDEQLWANAEIAGLQKTLREHPLYQSLKTHEDIQLFMENHVFAVWDFMSLLKALQHRFTSLTVPWTPSLHPRICHLINEMVLVEESDAAANGISHFEWYLDAMDQAEANMESILKLLQAVDAGEDSDDLWRSIPSGPDAFVRRTLSIARYAPSHVLAAEFVVGRENLIPEIFVQIVENMSSSEKDPLRHFVSYLKRHIEVDGEEHSVYSKQVLALTIDEDDARLQECIDTAIKSLESRVALWDHIHQQIQNRQKLSGSPQAL